MLAQMEYTIKVRDISLETHLFCHLLPYKSQTQ